MPGPTDSVVVVGAGLGGLSAALHLAGAGRQVTVVEQTDIPGGRAGVHEEAGYTFDTGPTVLTVPDLVDSTLAAVGESADGWLRMRRLDPAYRARFADGSVIDVRADPDAMADEIVAGVRCGRRRGLPPARRLPARAVCGRDAALHRPQSRLARATGRCTAVAAGGPGRLPATGAEDCHVPARRAFTPDLHLPGDVRRRGPDPGAGDIRRDHLPGLRGRRLLPGGRPARRPARSGRRGHQARCHHSLRHIRLADRGHEWASAGRAHRSRRAHRGRCRRRQR